MRLDDFPAAKKLRLAAAWADPEVRISDIRGRFGISWADSGALTKELGPKARLGAVCAVSINAQRRTGRVSQARGPR